MQRWKITSWWIASLCCLMVLAPARQTLAADNNVQVMAAASLTNVMNVLAKQFTLQTGIAVTTIYGGSGSLAKQIEQGSPADLFISADEKWMQNLNEKKLVNPNTIKPWLTNRLVMITPANKASVIPPQANTDLRPWLSGFWCTGDTLSVPVGIYAKQALTHLGWWEQVKPKLVSTQDVRAALTLVEREECDVGIVYASDALMTDKVRVAGQFAEQDHMPIVYPMATLPNSSRETLTFFRYLQSAEVSKLLVKYGFKPIAEGKY